MVAGNFKITVEDRNKFLYIVELKTGKKESAIEVKFSANTYDQLPETRKRIIDSYDKVCSYIIEKEFVGFIKEKLELSARVRSIVVPLTKIEFLIQSYKNYKKSSIK